MPLFPQSFIEDLRQQADIVAVVQDAVPLKKAGVNYRGLCPFHAEKTPSFNVNRDRGFFHCFGCGVGGDVFKFVELQHKVGFGDAVRLLAQRVGLAVPEAEQDRHSREEASEREALLKIHEEAAAWFVEQLAAAAGARARQQLTERKLTAATIDRLGLGYAPATRDGLVRRLRDRGFAAPSILRSGLALERESGGIVDRFRNRLMVPICRDSGAVIAFGGRAMASDQLPKYLNSPETPIYSKGRVLYGLHVTKGDIRRLGYAVVVEGYFDFAQALQAGVGIVLATCGTALTTAQARLLKRFASKVVLSFDPDAAGQGAATRSCELLVTEGFQVNVALLPPGQDPDTLIQREGPAAYRQRLKTSQPYLDFLLDRAAAAQDLRSDEGRRAFLTEMLGVAARIPDAALRDQFADRLAVKAQILEDVVRAEIRKAAVSRRTTLAAGALRPAGDLKPAEKGLIWALVHEPAGAVAAVEALEDGDLEGLPGGPILQAARSLRAWPVEAVPETLAQRLNQEEAALVQAIARETAPSAPADECVKALKRLRFERERLAVQREIDRLQRLGATEHDEEITALWMRKKDLVDRIEALTT